jgi:hypothetical protein
MKVLCILLLVANVGFVGWRMNQTLYGPAAHPPGESVVPRLPVDTPGLTLLSELPDSPAERATSAGTEGVVAAAEAPAVSGASDEEPPSSTPPATGMGITTPAVAEAGPTATSTDGLPPAAPPQPADSADATAAPVAGEPVAPMETTLAEETDPIELACASIGPYRSRDDMRAAIRELTPLTHRTASRTETTAEARLYTVFLEPTESEAEAQERISELKSKGITDYFLIRRGEMRNAIQVGTFRSQESVAKRLAELERTGYKTVVVPKSGGREQFWVDVAYDAARESLRSLKVRAGSGVKVLEAKCP